MKNIIKLITVLALLLAAQSCTKQKLKNAIVDKDCTGTYIRINSKAYSVCNKESLDNFNNGDQVNVKFQETQECDSVEIFCLLVYPYTVVSTVEILDVH